MDEKDILATILENKEEVCEWFADHPVAYEDMCNFVKKEKIASNTIDTLICELICEWLYNHKQAKKDVLSYINNRCSTKQMNYIYTSIKYTGRY